jgi:hypothetical protein
MQKTHPFICLNYQGFYNFEKEEIFGVFEAWTFEKPKINN